MTPLSLPSRSGVRGAAPALMLSLLLGACNVPPPMAGTPALRPADTVAASSLDGPAGAACPFGWMFPAVVEH